MSADSDSVCSAAVDGSILIDDKDSDQSHDDSIMEVSSNEQNNLKTGVASQLTINRENELRKRKSSGQLNTSGVNNCPICLTEMENATMLSGCYHVFCFNCILEWLRMKPECPLCKRSPKFFKHDFNVHSGHRPNWNSPGRIENIAEIRSTLEMDSIMVRTSYPADVERHAVMQVVSRLSEEVRMLRHMSFKSYGRESVYRQAVSAIEDELHEYENLLNMFGIASRRQIFNEPSFRRVIYLRNLSPRSIVPPQFGVVFNPDYIKNHEDAVRSQLMPFIVREYYAVSRNVAISIDELMDTIFDYLMSNKSRIYMVEYLKSHGVNHPHHFLNNLAHFAGTGQSLSVYDQNSEYTPRSSSVLPYISGSDDIMVLNSAINEDVQVVGEERRPLYRPSNRGGSLNSAATSAPSSSSAQLSTGTSAGSSLYSSLPATTPLNRTERQILDSFASRINELQQRIRSDAQPSRFNRRYNNNGRGDNGRERSGSDAPTSSSADVVNIESSDSSDSSSDSEVAALDNEGNNAIFYENP